MKWVDRKFAHPRGEWTIEPDRKEWIDPITGFECEAKRQSHGAWSGYVTIPASTFRPFPLSMHARVREELQNIDCHGGVTYSSVEVDNEAATIGFDCSHSYDYIPNSRHLLNSDTTYRNLAYVEAECTKICHQAMIILNTVIV